jgi:type IV pilus assembly protein PilQ
LGDLPFVGFLFKQNLKTDDRNELLIFITPRILKDGLTLRQ